MNKMAKCALALMMMIVLMMASAAAEVKVGTNSYDTMKAAVQAEGANKTYEIYGKVTGYFEGTGDSTFVGMDDDAEIEVNPDTYYSYGSVRNVTFRNLTFTTNNKNFKGFQGSNSETFINCVIKGVYWTYATNAAFEGCTFIQSGSEPYCLWSYGTENLTVSRCTFISDHKFILFYKDEADPMTANVKDNVFVYSDSISSELEKAAIEIDDTNSKVTLNATNNEVDCRNPRGLYYDKQPDKDQTTVKATGTKGYHDDNLTHKNEVAATQTATGVDEHWVCEDCGTLFADQNGAVEVSKDDLIIPVLVPAATPVPDTSSMPQTGDNSNIALFAALLTMSAAGMLLLMRRRSTQR